MSIVLLTSVLRRIIPLNTISFYRRILSYKLHLRAIYTRRDTVNYLSRPVYSLRRLRNFLFWLSHFFYTMNEIP